MMKIAPAVAQAAMDSGVALRPIKDMQVYIEKLQSFVYASGTVMKPIFIAAKCAKKKGVGYSEGEEERVLRATQIVVDEGLAIPTLIGRPKVIAARIEKFGLRLVEGVDYAVVNVEQDTRYRDFWQTYLRMTERKGITTPVSYTHLDVYKRQLPSLQRLRSAGLFCAGQLVSQRVCAALLRRIGARRRAS